MGLTTLAALALVVLLPGSLTLRGEALNDEPGEIVFLEEGDLATVQVLQDPREPAEKAMAVDGCKIGWSKAYRGQRSYRKQVLLAHLPMVLDTRIRKTLNIGLGSGSTLNALAAYGQVESLDCVEISAAVVRAARFFEESAVLDDPRVSLIVDDAVHYLLCTEKAYDLIISDGKQNPFASTNAPLLCREFYEYSLARMTKRGLFVQWMSLTTLHFDLRVNLRTMGEVFPCLEVFYYPDESVFMVGSEQPLATRPQMSEQQFKDSPAGDELEPYFLTSRPALLSRWVAGKGQLQSVLGAGPVSRWDRLLVDFSPFKAGRQERARAPLDNLRVLLAAEEAGPGPEGTSFEPRATLYWLSSRLIRRSFAAHFEGRRRDAQFLAEQAVAANPDDAAARAVLALMRKRAKEPPAAGR